MHGICLIHSFQESLLQLDSSGRVSSKSIIQLDSLDGLNSTDFEVVSSYHDQTLALMLTLPRGRIWDCTVIAYCKFATFELSKYYLFILMMQYHIISCIYIHVHSVHITILCQPSC
jgi:hypothetical protein